MSEQSLQILIGVLGGVVVMLVLAVGFLLGSRRRAAPAKPELPPITLPPGMEALEPTFAELRRQLGDLGGKIEQVRVSAEARQGPENQAWQGIQQVQTTLAALGQLPEIQQSLQVQVASALRELEAIKGRQPQEDKAFHELDRLTAVLLGSKTAGEAGERMVEEALGTLPPQWVLRQHRVNNQPVEYAVRLPDGHILPIDSKVAALPKVREWEQTEDAAERAALEKTIRETVRSKSGEIRKYLGDGSTDFGVITVPDGVYRFCRSIAWAVYQEHHALLVPYSLLASFVVMVHEQHRRGDLDLRAERTQRLLSDATGHLRKADEVLNQHLAGGIKQVNNAYDSLSRELAESVRAVTLLHEMAPHDPG
jgi:DNA recombination protein RmuC